MTVISRVLKKIKIIFKSEFRKEKNDDNKHTPTHILAAVVNEFEIFSRIFDWQRLAGRQRLAQRENKIYDRIVSFLNN